MMRYGAGAFFDFARYGASLRGEIAGGLTTFLTMSYIIAVNPAILHAAGIPEGPAITATIATAVFGCLAMGLIANRPFAIAPYMGENAFVAYTVVRVMGVRWEVALGSVFIAGVLFALLTVAKIRSWMADALPAGLSHSFAAGIGLFLAFIGLTESGLVILGVPGAPVQVGNLASAHSIIAIGSFIAIAMLMLWRVPGAILLGIVAASIAAFASGVAHPPEHFVSLPPSLAPVLMHLDIAGALGPGLFGVTLSIFVMALVDTMGSLIGVSARAGFLDENGNLPEIERPMLADALATIFAALAGTTTSGAYIESAAGVSAGARTGLSAIVVAALFAASLFFAPIVTAIPAVAYGPALIVVGAMMLASVRHIDFDDMSELIPAFSVIALMSFTFNIGLGVTAGLILYPLFKLAASRADEVRPGLWVLAGLSTLFFILYPWR